MIVSCMHRCCGQEGRSIQTWFCFAVLGGLEMIDQRERGSESVLDVPGVQAH